MYNSKTIYTVSLVLIYLYNCYFTICNLYLQFYNLQIIFYNLQFIIYKLYNLFIYINVNEIQSQIPLLGKPPATNHPADGGAPQLDTDGGTGY